MPPRRGTPWVPHGSLLSDRIRPSSGSPQPIRSEKGKGKAKAATPEPPPRSAAVRKLDELLDGLLLSSTSNQQPKIETRKATTVLGASDSVDHEGCFCQGTSASLVFYLCLHIFFRFQIHYCIYHCSPNTRIIGIHAPLLILRSRPLRSTTSAPSLPTLHNTAPHATRTSGAHSSIGRTACICA